MKNIKKYSGIVLLAFVTLAACKKEHDTPPLNAISAVITLDSLRNIYQGAPVHFTQDYSVYGVITADETDGNLYKNLYVQDESAAINIRLMNSGGFYIGDKVRIYLNGTVLSNYNGVLQLDSVVNGKNIVRQASNVAVQPLDVNITDINSSLQSQLIRVNNVEFAVDEIGKTYADGANQLSENRILNDCSGNTIIVRTSGFANYANLPVATGHGALVAIVGEYNGDMQLYIRRYSEINMTGTRCSGNPPFLKKDFEDNNVTSGGWSIQNVSGSVNWTINGIGASSGSYYSQCSNYFSSANHACDTWLISPSVNLGGSANPVLSFINAYKYSGPALQVYVSTDYVSGAPSTGTWTQLTGWTASPGSFTWVNSGPINLSAYKTNNVHVAFRYTGSSSDGSTWEVDDIQIAEQ